MILLAVAPSRRFLYCISRFWSQMVFWASYNCKRTVVWIITHLQVIQGPVNTLARPCLTLITSKLLENYKWEVRNSKIKWLKSFEVTLVWIILDLEMFGRSWLWGKVNRSTAAWPTLVYQTNATPKTGVGTFPVNKIILRVNRTKLPFHVVIKPHPLECKMMWVRMQGRFSWYNAEAWPLSTNLHFCTTLWILRGRKAASPPFSSILSSICMLIMR